MTILVTGGEGFIAQYIKKENQKLGMDIIYADKKTNSNYQIDLATETDKLEKLFTSENIEYVIHLAGQSSVLYSQTNPIQDINDNIIATVNLLNECKKHQIKRFIFSSSASVYGEQEKPNEKNETKPTSNYGITKLSCEHYIRNFDIPYTIFRFSNVYGNNGRGVISAILDSIKNKKTFFVNGDGQQTRDYIYAKDIAKNLLSCIKNTDLAYKKFNLSTGTGTNLNDLIHIIEQIIGEQIKIEYRGYQTAEIKHSILDNKAYISYTNYQFTPLREGLLDMKEDKNVD